MIMQHIRDWVQQVPLVLRAYADGARATWLSLANIFLILILMWRLWTFTIRPVLNPREPKQLPYWVPRQAIEYVQDCHGVLTRARKYFRNSLEPYSITLGGQKVYILTAPQDVSLAYKSNTLSYDSFNLDFTILYGVTPAAVHKVFAEPLEAAKEDKEPHVNPLNKSVAHWSEDLYRQQLHPGPRLDLLADKFVVSIGKALEWDRLTALCRDPSNINIDTASLLSLCKKVIIDGATQVFFGDRILEIEPQLSEAFCQFDNHSYMLMYKYPAVFANIMFAAKSRINDAFTKYFELPREQRKGETWLATMEENEFRKLNFKNEDIAKFFSLMHWVVNANTYKLCFWLLSYLLHDEALLASIREETDLAFKGDNIDLNHLTKECPRLEALLNEILRFTVSSQSTRRVDAPTSIGGKILQPGAFVFIPYRQLHFNEDVFGNDASVFVADRFLKNKELSRHPSFRPFGGGTTYCPGRFIARQEVYIFVALMLNRYDLGLASLSQHFPRVNDKNPALGAIGPMPGDDLNTYRIEPSPPSSALRSYFDEYKHDGVSWFNVAQNFEELTDQDYDYWHERSSIDQRRYQREKWEYNDTILLDEELHTDEEAEAEMECGNGVATLRAELERKRSEQRWIRYRQDHCKFNESVATSDEVAGPGEFHRFGDLPAEIRRLVFKFVFCKPTSTKELRLWRLEYEYSDIDSKLRFTHLSPLDTRILAANRHIYEEALDVLYSSSCFVIDINDRSTLPPFISHATGHSAPRPTSRIRRWHIRITFTNAKRKSLIFYQLGRLREEMSKCPRLDEVRFTWVSVPYHKAVMPDMIRAYDTMLAMFKRLRGVSEVVYTTSLSEREIDRANEFLDGWSDVSLASEEVRRAVKTSMESSR
ncbi:MAG: hypothetical protein Q9222_002860 [Ikaeria aurantiellina]